MRALVLLTFLTAVISAPAGLNQQAIESLIEELEADVRSELPVILEGLASLDSVNTDVGTPAPSRTFTPPDGKLMVEGVVADAPSRTFTPQAGDEIVARLSKGEPLTVICRDLNVTDRTVRNWADADAAFASDIARAREKGFDQIALDALKIADDKEGEHQRDRLRVDTRLKLLAKWDPKRYGDRVTHQGDSEADAVKVDHSVALKFV